MLNIIICDDDASVVREAREILENVLRANSRIGRITEYTNANSFLFDIQEYKPLDLVILDIEMPDVSGMQIAAEIKQRFPECCIILLTQHAQYAIEAYELNIFRYTPKSHMQEKLPQYVTDALKLTSLQSGLVYTVSSGDGLERLPYSQMLFVRKDGKYSVVTCVDGREIRTRKSLQSVCAELDEQEFIQIDRGCIVNVSMISQITSDDVVCKNGLRLPISRIKAKEIKSKIALYWGKRI